MATGQVYKRGKAWYLSIYTGVRNADGTYERIRMRARGEGKKDASEHLAEVLHFRNVASINGGAHDNSCLLSVIRELWCKEIDLQIKREKTKHDYILHLDRMYDWLQRMGVFRVDSITNDCISAFKRDMIASGISHRTINLSLQKLKAAIEFAKDNGVCVSNPMRKIRQLPDKRVKYRRDLKPDEVHALIKCAGTEYGRIWYFMVSTGVRLDEMASLLWDNIDFDKDTIYIRGNDENTVKTMTSNRALPMSAELKDVLLAHRKATSGRYVFGLNGGVKKRTNGVLHAFKRHMYNALCDMRGYPYGKGLRLSEEQTQEFGEGLASLRAELAVLDVHALRYTFITELISRGVDPKTVQALAGHKDIQTTLNIYAQCRQGNIDNAVSSLPWKFLDTNLDTSKS